ncbi:polysialyltransferase family glycosyltransferase [Caldimonas sp. KR1-144]|uniref:polysialyltransferase family glycosyltransferase n=1 Tax=Caldimonas sp. KR1-144 TaxID=3400911 RepID=UPI003C103523
MSLGTAPGRHVFLARSSLQFLLSAAMAESLRDGPRATSRIIFLPDMLDPALHAQVVASWADPPVDRVVFIEPRGARSAAQVRRDLSRALAEAQPLSVTVFNDREEAGQTLLIEAAKRFAHATRRCAEDGALAYTGFTYRPHGWWVRWRQRLRMGAGWADVRVLGTHPLVQEYHALHPALLRRELAGPRVRALPGAALNAPSIRRFANDYCARAGFDPSNVPDNSALLTLSHSSYAQRNPDYVERLRTCAAALAASGARLYVKHHPREVAPDPLGLLAQGLGTEVPRGLPAECIYLLWRERPVRVIGGMSTSLLTAALLMPNARVEALLHASNAGDSWDPALLEALRISPWRGAGGEPQARFSIQ